MGQSSERVAIRGTSDGLTISVGSGDWQMILDALEKKLRSKASFFKGGRAVLQVGDRLLDATQIEAAGALLAGHTMTLWSVNGNAAETQAAARSLGLETRGTAAPPAPAGQLDEPVEPTSTTLTVRRTLRSGQHVEHPGHVVVIGDVNPGAKVVAGGHVIVWGRLRGTVQAGAILPEEGFVCALDLAPMQLIIGNLISRSPGDEAATPGVPEMAFVQDGQIVAEPWR